MELGSITGSTTAVTKAKKQQEIAMDPNASSKTPPKENRQITTTDLRTLHHTMLTPSYRSMDLAGSASKRLNSLAMSGQT